MYFVLTCWAKGLNDTMMDISDIWKSCDWRNFWAVLLQRKCLWRWMERITIKLHLQSFTRHIDSLFSWKQPVRDFHFKIALYSNINQIFLSELSRLIGRHYSAYVFLKNSNVIFRWFSIFTWNELRAHWSFWYMGNIMNCSSLSSSCD